MSLGPFTSGARWGKFVTRVSRDTALPFPLCVCSSEDTSGCFFPTQVCDELCLCPRWVRSPGTAG